MPQLGTALILLAKPCSVLTIALILPLMIGAVPAQAQGIFGFFRALSQPTAPTLPPHHSGISLMLGLSSPGAKPDHARSL